METSRALDTIRNLIPTEWAYGEEVEILGHTFTLAVGEGSGPDFISGESRNIEVADFDDTDEMAAAILEMIEETAAFDINARDQDGDETTINVAFYPNDEYGDSITQAAKFADFVSEMENVYELEWTDVDSWIDGADETILEWLIWLADECPNLSGWVAFEYDSTWAIMGRDELAEAITRQFKWSREEGDAEALVVATEKGAWVFTNEQSELDAVSELMVKNGRSPSRKLWQATKDAGSYKNPFAGLFFPSPESAAGNIAAEIESEIGRVVLR